VEKRSNLSRDLKDEVRRSKNVSQGRGKPSGNNLYEKGSRAGGYSYNTDLSHKSSAKNIYLQEGGGKKKEPSEIPNNNYLRNLRMYEEENAVTCLKKLNRVKNADQNSSSNQIQKIKRAINLLTKDWKVS